MIPKRIVPVAVCLFIGIAVGEVSFATTTLSREPIRLASPGKRWVKVPNASWELSQKKLQENHVNAYTTGFTMEDPRSLGDADWDAYFTSAFRSAYKNLAKSIIPELTTASLSVEEIKARYIADNGPGLSSMINEMRSQLNDVEPFLLEFHSAANTAKDPEAFYNSRPALTAKIPNVAEWKSILRMYSSREKIEKYKSVHLASVEGFMETMGDAKTWSHNRNHQITAILSARDPLFEVKLPAVDAKDPNFSARSGVLANAMMVVVLTRALKSAEFDSADTRRLLVSDMQQHLTLLTDMFGEKLFEPEREILRRLE